MREIATILASIRKETIRAAEAMRGSMQSMGDGLAVAHNAREARGQAAAAIEETQRISLDVAEATRSMQRASGEVAADMANVSSIVERHVAAAHELWVASTAVDETIGAVAQFASQQSGSTAQAASSAREIALETSASSRSPARCAAARRNCWNSSTVSKGGEIAGLVAAANVGKRERKSGSTG